MMVTKLDWLLAGCVAVLANSIGLGSFALAENAEFELQLEYRVSWSNADIASATANWSFGDTGFELAATSRTLGITETVRKYRGKVEISGRIENGRHAPDTLYLSGISKRRTREAMETGRRVRELQARAQAEAAHKQIMAVHRASANSFIDDIFGEVVVADARATYTQMKATSTTVMTLRLIRR